MHSLTRSLEGAAITVVTADAIQLNSAGITLDWETVDDCDTWLQYLPNYTRLVFISS